MKRKINRVGLNTLTVSLPSKWANDNNLKAGDELHFHASQNEISFSVAEKKQKEKEITINIDSLNKYLLSKYLIILYIENYNKIILTYTNMEIYDDKNKKNTNIKNTIMNLCNRFIGMEIVSQTNNKTELACFILKDMQELQVIEKRIYFLLKETIDELLQAIDKDYHYFHQGMYDKHDSIIKFLYYYLRTLDSSDKSEDEKKTLYALYMTIDHVIDKIRHLSEKIDENGYTTQVKKHIEEIFALFCDFFNTLHKGKISKEVVAKRYQLVKKIESAEYTLKEFKIISEIKILLDFMNDFYHVLVAREVEKGE
ncbi:hypothetical protein HZA96_02765 [Candidatus Woesearchaeota archaeon]|nr:hypothetical protein [Candidatus Woesearchaeota archaeon]